MAAPDSKNIRNMNGVWAMVCISLKSCTSRITDHVVVLEQSRIRSDRSSPHSCKSCLMSILIRLSLNCHKQGISWFVRKAINMITVTVIVTQSENDDGSTQIHIFQPGTAGMAGTTEKRTIPKDPTEKLWKDHKDTIFGQVKGGHWNPCVDLVKATLTRRYRLHCLAGTRWLER